MSLSGVLISPSRMIIPRSLSVLLINKNSMKRTAFRVLSYAGRFKLMALAKCRGKGGVGVQTKKVGRGDLWPFIVLVIIIGARGIQTLTHVDEVNVITKAISTKQFD
jgi:hypothetical protein